MSDQKLSVPAAIVIAGAMVAAAVFLGLRTKAPAPVAPGSAALPKEIASAVEAAPRPAPPPMKPDAQKVARDAAASLELQRSELSKRCWEPAARLKPAPAYIDYMVDATFDAAGAQLARGMSEERRTARADVTACVSMHLKPLSVPAPGGIVRVEIPFRLP